MENTNILYRKLFYFRSKFPFQQDFKSYCDLALLHSCLSTGGIPKYRSLKLVFYVFQNHKNETWLYLCLFLHEINVCCTGNVSGRENTGCNRGCEIHVGAPFWLGIIHFLLKKEKSQELKESIVKLSCFNTVTSVNEGCIKIPGL